MRNAAIKKEMMWTTQPIPERIDWQDGRSPKEKVSTFSLVTNNAWSAFKAIKHLDIEILHNSSKLHLKGK